MSELSTDWWLSGADLRAPKREVGDYVEAQGFLVPRRFDTLDEALALVKQGGRIVIRSEHPDEYDGASGLMQTYIVDEESAEEAQDAFTRYGQFDIDEQVALSQRRSAVTAYGRGEMPGYSTMADVVLGVALDTQPDITIARLKRLTGQRDSVQRYAELTGRSVVSLMTEADFSFWEYLPGANVTVVADSAIDDRYHVLANRPQRKGMPTYNGWQIADERGNSVAGTEDDLVLTPQATEKLIRRYEEIRNLSRFAAEHCPIMELQLDQNGNIWFLQYHRARDFKAAGDPLNPTDFPSAEGWQKVDGVRGALEIPTTLNTALWYPVGYGASSGDTKLPEVEDASMDWHWDWALSEILSRRRSAYIEKDSLEWLYSTLAAAHTPRSKWFKPQVAVACDDRRSEKLIPEDVKEEISKAVHREGRLAQVAIDLAADGNSGYIRLSPDREQPVYAD